MRSIPLLLAATCVTAGVYTQERNVHVLYSNQKTQFATRSTTDKDDMIFYVQPTDFHANNGKSSGFQIVLQDWDQSTGETVKLSWHKADANGNVTLAPIVRQTYNLFGLGQGIAAYDYKLLTASQVDVPCSLALGAWLPKEHGQSFPSDVVLLQYQRGDNTKTPFAARRQLTFDQHGAGNTQRARWVKGSTFRWGGLYARPVVQLFTRSTAYGQGAENLFGLESMFPVPGRGDLVGVRLSGDRFVSTGTQPPSHACLLASPGYFCPGLQTPCGPFMLAAPMLALFAVSLDQNGNATWGPFPIPNIPGARLSFQAGLISLVTFRCEFTNATTLTVKSTN